MKIARVGMNKLNMCQDNQNAQQIPVVSKLHLESKSLYISRGEVSLVEVSLTEGVRTTALQYTFLQGQQRQLQQ